MNAQALLQVGLGLLGVSALLQALSLTTTSAVLSLSLGGRGVVALGLLALQVLALFAASYLLILHNRRLAGQFIVRSAIGDAPLGMPDVRKILIGLFGLYLLVRALSVASALRLVSQRVTPEYLGFLIIQVGAALFLTLRPAKVLELWEPRASAT